MISPAHSGNQFIYKSSSPRTYSSFLPCFKTFTPCLATEISTPDNDLNAILLLALTTLVELVV